MEVYDEVRRNPGSASAHYKNLHRGSRRYLACHQLLSVYEKIRNEDESERPFDNVYILYADCAGMLFLDAVTLSRIYLGYWNKQRLLSNFSIYIK